MVVEADDTGDLPSSILFFLPEVNELGLANGLPIVLSGVVEAVHTNFYRAIVGNGIDLKCPGTSSRVTFPQMLFLTPSIVVCRERLKPPTS
jgi:hypothetical protein